MSWIIVALVVAGAISMSTQMDGQNAPTDVWRQAVTDDRSAVQRGWSAQAMRLMFRALGQPALVTLVRSWPAGWAAARW